MWPFLISITASLSHAAAEALQHQLSVLQDSVQSLQMEKEALKQKVGGHVLEYTAASHECIIFTVSHTHTYTVY